MHPGVFMGFAWNVGNPMTFKVLQFNTNPHKGDMVVHRGVIVSRTLTAMGDNYALAPSSDAYFLQAQLEAGTNRIPVAP